MCKWMHHKKVWPLYSYYSCIHGSLEGLTRFLNQLQVAIRGTAAGGTFLFRPILTVICKANHDLKFLRLHVSVFEQ